MKIRLADDADLEAVHALLIEMYSEEKETLDPYLKDSSKVVDYYKKIVEERFSDEDSVVLVAEDEGKLVGFSIAYLMENELREPSDKAYIRTIYVKKDHRNKGAGSALLEQVVSWARDKNAGWVEADAYAANKEGLDFWATQGFRPLFTLITKKLD
ncbi:MAG: GNAT family N-acetyltransferase [Candidatus Altiarchaeota archaeon]